MSWLASHWASLVAFVTLAVVAASGWLSAWKARKATSNERSARVANEIARADAEAKLAQAEAEAEAVRKVAADLKKINQGVANVPSDPAGIAGAIDDALRGK